MSDKTLSDKAIDIKGKKYAMVKDRVQWLSENKEGEYSIKTYYQYLESQRMWVVQASLMVGDNTYMGTAQEVESDDTKAVNNASALENCETSAIGRACAAFGLGIQESYASANEMNKKPRTISYASVKQIQWMRSEASQATGLEEAGDIDKWIEKLTGTKPNLIPGWQTSKVVDQIRSGAAADSEEDIQTIKDIVYDPDQDDLDKIDLGDVGF